MVKMSDPWTEQTYDQLMETGNYNCPKHETSYLDECTQCSEAITELKQAFQDEVEKQP